jgi:hypothetical protein
MKRRRRRLQPYTARGIRRVRCCYKSCRRRGFANWRVGDEYLAPCWVHHLELTFLALEWAFDPDRKAKHAKYSADVIRRVNARKVA